MKTLHKEFTGANRGNGEGNQNVCSLRSLLFKSSSDTTSSKPPSWPNDNPAMHAKVTSVNSSSASATQAVADKNPSRANANKHARALAKREGTGANRGNGEGNQNLCSLCFLLFKSGPGGVVQLDFDKSISDGVNIYAKRDGDADFVFLARDTASPYIDNRLPAL